MLSRNDGYDSWRISEAKNLSQLISRKLNDLQNPQDCKNSKIIKWNPYRRVGWGSVIHQIAKCMSIGFYLNRRMVFPSTSISFEVKRNFEGILEPFSNKCQSLKFHKKMEAWTGIRLKFIW